MLTKPRPSNSRVAPPQQIPRSLAKITSTKPFPKNSRKAHQQKLPAQQRLCGKRRRNGARRRIPEARSAKGIMSEAKFAPTRKRSLVRRARATPAKPRLKKNPRSLTQTAPTKPRLKQYPLSLSRATPAKPRLKQYPRSLTQTTPRKAQLCGEEEEQRSGAKNSRSAKRKGDYERSEVCSDEEARSANGIMSEAKFAPTRKREAQRGL